MEKKEKTPKSFARGKRATRVELMPSGNVRVIYHATPVVEFNGKGVTLDTGGWWTATTKKRMNQAARFFSLDFYVY